jgi:hypothetical protein
MFLEFFEILHDKKVVIHNHTVTSFNPQIFDFEVFSWTEKYSKNYFLLKIFIILSIKVTAFKKNLISFAVAAGSTSLIFNGF